MPAKADDEAFATGLPGLPNLHSHAFQRIMAGLAERRQSAAGDDFWTWRDLMYGIVRRLSPQDLAAIAAMAYVEMLESGFTRVGEFHYLHHQPNGHRYDNLAEMALAIAEAAEETGIGLTLLPVFYAHSGFGGLPPRGDQSRFVCGLDEFLRLREGCVEAVARLTGGVVGVAPHSLRAVTPDELRALVTQVQGGPVHIHIAEQGKEVEDCLAWSGQRPIAWLMNHAPVDDRWCLVHATHAVNSEVRAISASGAVVGLCPITEANLGDGIFPAGEFVAAGGAFGIGSDSNVLISAAEELRLLEYGQRLAHRKRAVLAEPCGSNGRLLFSRALAGAHQALGAKPTIRVGDCADIVALADHPLDLQDQALDRWIFADGGVDAVWRAGRQVVRGGRHAARDRVQSRYLDVVRRLLA